MNKIVGTIILYDTMNSGRYFNRLRDEIRSMMSTLKNINDLIFMKDDLVRNLPLYVIGRMSTSLEIDGLCGRHERPA